MFYIVDNSGDVYGEYSDFDVAVCMLDVIISELCEDWTNSLGLEVIESFKSS